MRPRTLHLTIKRPDLLSAICEAAEKEGEMDYTYWTRQYLKRSLFKQPIKTPGGKKN